MTDIILDRQTQREWQRQRQEQREQAEGDAKQTEKERLKSEKKAKKDAKKAAKERLKAKKKAAKERAKAEKARLKALKKQGKDISLLTTDQQTPASQTTYTEIPAAPANQEAETSQAVSVLPILAILGVCLYFVLKQRRNA